MKTRNLSLCALFSALIALCSWISLPVLDIAFTMQSFAVFLALFVLGGRLGLGAIAVYLCLGLAGLPVFSGFQGGLGALLGMTGGFLWGFLLAGGLFWGLCFVFGKKWKLLWAGFSMLLCYLCGCLWYFFAYAQTGALGFGAVAVKCVVPYLLPDGVKILLAWRLSRRLQHFL